MDTRKLPPCLALLCLLLPCASVQGVSYLLPYSLQGVRLAPSLYTGNLSPLVGGWEAKPFSGAPLFSWHVAQWGIVEDLPTATSCSGECQDREWQLGNAYATVEAQDGGITLTQDARDPAFACREFDLYLEPNDAGYPGYAPGIVPFTPPPSLAASASLVVGATQEIREARQGTRCDPGWNLATTLVALLFLNPTAEQVIFYQLITYDSRGAHFGGFWFFTGPTVYGINDSVDVLGFPPLVPYEGPVAYRIDVLPRLTELLANGPAPLDRDVRHWKVSGLYLGSATNGEAQIVSTHGNVSLVGELK